MKRKIIISLGSNFEQEKYIRKGMELLAGSFPGIRFSSLLWTEPLGIQSDKFVNAMALATTDLDEDAVVEILKKAEVTCGRMPEDKALNIVKIDLDLLQYGCGRRKVADWNRSYIKQLAAEVCL